MYSENESEVERECFYLYKGRDDELAIRGISIKCGTDKRDTEIRFCTISRWNLRYRSLDKIEMSLF